MKVHETWQKDIDAYIVYSELHKHDGKNIKPMTAEQRKAFRKCLDLYCSLLTDKIPRERVATTIKDMFYDGYSYKRIENAIRKCGASKGLQKELKSWQPIPFTYKWDKREEKQRNSYLRRHILDALGGKHTEDADE